MRGIKDAAVSVKTRVSKLIDDLLYERRFGLDTELTAYPEGTADGSDRLPYGAATWRLLPRWLDPGQVSPSDVFVDVGCGKGRVVFQAARLYPFKRVIGVDLAPELIEIAQSNIDKTRDRLRCNDVELVAADVTEWEVPDDVTVVFLHNPFGGAVFQSFLDHLDESLERNPRDLLIIYALALEHKALERDPRVKLIASTGDGRGPLISRIADRVSGVSDEAKRLRVRVYRLRARSSEGSTTLSASSPPA